MTRVNEDINVYISLEATPSEYLIQHFEQRQLNHNELWLISFANHELERANFTSLNLDLDDDVMIYKESNNWLNIKEIYKLRASNDLVTINFGNYSIDQGWSYPNKNKWQRRMDLTVNYSIF